MAGLGVQPKSLLRAYFPKPTFSPFLSLSSSAPLENDNNQHSIPSTSYI